MISGRRAKTLRKMTMISIIGNKFFCLRPGTSPKKGLSFFEVMVTISVLSLGLVMIFRAFLISLDTIGHLTYRWHAMMLLENKISEIQQRFQTTGEIPMDLTDQPEKRIVNHREIHFGYKTEIRDFINLGNIFQLTLTIFWRERNRDINISQSAYIIRYAQ